MSSKTIGVSACVLAAILYLNGGKHSPPVVASAPVATFDYGDPPAEPAAVGSSSPLVIDSPADVAYGAGPSAFSEYTASERPVVPLSVIPLTPPADIGDVADTADVASPPVAASRPPALLSSPPLPLPVLPARLPATIVSSSPPSAFDPPAVAAGDDWVTNVFPVQCHDFSGCAVAVAPDTLLSVYHVARYSTAVISRSGGTVNGHVLHPPGADALVRDGAIIKVANGQFPAMRTRAAVYYEPVTIYGLKTKTKQRGYVSAPRTVSLLPATTGIAVGDSGGAVVADDGSLVGLISGFDDGTTTQTPANPRVVMFTRIEYLSQYLPKMEANAASNQPSAFDPPAPVAQPRCAAPMQTRQSAVIVTPSVPRGLFRRR